VNASLGECVTASKQPMSSHHPIDPLTHSRS